MTFLPKTYADLSLSHEISYNKFMAYLVEIYLFIAVYTLLRIVYLVPLPITGRNI